MTESRLVVDYIEDVRKIKAVILQSRYMAARLANAEQLKLYFSIGAYVSVNSRKGKWGTGAIEAISNRLQVELPGLRGFSARSIAYMRSFYETWHKELASFLQLPIAKTGAEADLHSASAEKETEAVRQPPIADLGKDDVTAFWRIGFTHHIILLERCKDIAERWYYIR